MNFPPHPHASAAKIDWYSFLARPRLPSPNVESLEQLRDTSILVTGAGGSIGSALSLQLTQLHPKHLVLLDASEQSLHRLQSQLAETALSTQPSLALASINDRSHLDEIFEIHRPQLVFHAAAYKHVPLLEEHPLEAISNNAIGTGTLIECAKKSGTVRIVLLSTDKAVEPINILGATKRIAELATLAAGGVVLRLGNVLGTEGSVSETFLRQISAGDPITITASDAERYFLTCEEAVDLLLASAIAAPPACLLVPNLDRQHSIASLADFLARTCSSEKPSPVTFTGLRPGDKAREALWSSDEQPFRINEHGYSEIRQHIRDYSLLRHDLNQLEDAVRERDLASALELVLRLVPSYQPGSTVTALASHSPSGAAQR